MTATARVRRLRRAQTSQTPTPQAAAEEQLRELVAMMHARDELSAEIDFKTKELNALMEKTKLEEVNAMGWKALRYRPAGRSSTLIDPVKFRKAMKNDDEAFFACVTISVTKAREYLSERELRSVSTVTEGVPGDWTIKLQAPRKGTAKPQDGG